MPDYRVKRSKDNEDLPEIIELLADAWASARSVTKRRQILDSATRGQRLLCSYYFYWDDVTNGGHHQYFWNYTGNLWPEALEATRILRLPEENILRSAVALFPKKQPGLTEPERRKQLAKIDSAKFDKLDDRFYSLDGASERIRQFIDSNPNDFFVPIRSKRR
jgi:hypothetical protein